MLEGLDSSCFELTSNTTEQAPDFSCGECRTPPQPYLCQRTLKGITGFENRFLRIELGRRISLLSFLTRNTPEP